MTEIKKLPREAGVFACHYPITISRHRERGRFVHQSPIDSWQERPFDNQLFANG